MSLPLVSKRLRAASLALPALVALSTTELRAATADEFATTATYVCRASLPGEGPSAKMLDEPTLLACKPLAVSMRMDDGSVRTIGNVAAKPAAGPDFSHALTPGQINEAYERWYEHTLGIDPAIVHSS